jgi:hypothetical protein
MDQIVIRENSVLTKTDIKRRFKELFPHLKYTNEIAQGIEHQIMENFGIDWKCSKIFSVPYKGWLGLTLKDLSDID